MVERFSNSDYPRSKVGEQTVKSANFMATFGQRAYRQGWHSLVAVRPRDKAAFESDWPRIAAAGVTREWLSGWMAKPALSVGIAMTGGLVAVDCDIGDPERIVKFREELFATCGPTPFVRWGHRGPVFIYAVEGGVSPKTASGDEVQFLGEGAQVVCAGIHPVSGQPYRWEDLSPDMAGIDRVPTIGMNQLQIMIGRYVGQPATEHSEGDFWISPPPVDLDVEALQACVARIANDDLSYDDWLRVGFAIRHVAGEELGWPVFKAFSEKASKNDPDQTARKWKTMGDADGRAGQHLLLSLAQGWKPAEDRPLFDRQPWSIDFDNLMVGGRKFRGAGCDPEGEAYPLVPWATMPLFVIDGFIQEGAVGLAGEPGVGKTTLLAPVALHAAGLKLLPGLGDAPRFPRVVVMFTEAPEQMKNLIYASLWADQPTLPSKQELAHANHRAVGHYRHTVDQPPTRERERQQ